MYVLFRIPEEESVGRSLHVHVPPLEQTTRILAACTRLDEDEKVWAESDPHRRSCWTKATSSELSRSRHGVTELEPVFSPQFRITRTTRLVHGSKVVDPIHQRTR